MAFVLKPLPYGTTALEPVMTERTLMLHHGKHHAGYVAKLNQLVAGTSLEKTDLESIIGATYKQSKRRAIYNNAAQIWNHDFFWSSIGPNGGGAPPEPLRKRIEAVFQSMENFTQRFVDTATQQFGSGWVWLVVRDGKLNIVASHDADSPLTTNAYPLMVCDVWEHAYYLDYQNRRAEFVKAVLDKLIDWQHITKQLAEADQQMAIASRSAHA